MLHKWLEAGDWFAPKRFGYGAGLPIAWQGWVLSLAYCLAISGIAYGLPQLHFGLKLLAIAGILAITGLFILIVARHTRGGWHWRWGQRE